MFTCSRKTDEKNPISFTVLYVETGATDDEIVL